MRGPPPNLLMARFGAKSAQRLTRTRQCPPRRGRVTGLLALGLSSLPWLCAMVAMFGLARVGDRTGRRKPILAGQLLTAGAGSPVWSYTAPAWASPSATKWRPGRSTALN
ncbi:hypothetical protein [Streptomyces sp. NPDC021212]|uniref:hypothetical protein n=1 Tax=Streptomyces sp. NPDC021212 TaxID=3365118 RepID=UPI0037A4D10D